MEAKEAINKLKDIRQRYENGEISMDTANIIGKFYVDTYNNKAREVARKFNSRPALLRNNVKFYPTY